MNTNTCTCDTCGARADITLEANGHKTTLCIGCSEAFSPMLDYTIRAARTMRAAKAGRVVVAGSILTEAMLPECFDIDAEVPLAILAELA